MIVDQAGQAGSRAAESSSAGGAGAATPLQAWMAELVQSRGLKGPTGQPLHRYQLTAQELVRLIALLRDEREQRDEPRHRDSWVAGYSLCAAESYRREYDGPSFSLDTLEQALDCPLTEEQRPALLEAGLAYWKRPRLMRDGATGLAGVLSAEGGLPWKLVQRHQPELDAAIRQALARSPFTASGGETTAGLLAAGELPEVFRSLDIRGALAGLVDQLMQLAGEHPLSAHPDPAAYLDQHAPGWQAAFPLPVDEPDARALLCGWLAEAGARLRQQAAAARGRIPGCRHRLQGGAGSHWRLTAELTLPAEEEIKVDLKTLSSTRLVAAVYEGERLLQLAGTVHALTQEDGLKVQYPQQVLGVDRQNFAEPLSLRLLEGGRSIHSLPFDGSALDIDEMPLVFEACDGQQWLAATASGSLVASRALIRVPPGARHDGAAPVFTEEGGACWIETASDVTVRKAAETYRITVNRTEPADAIPALQGARAPLPAGPGVVFLGWPALAPGSDLVLLIDGEPLTGREDEVPGVYRCSVRAPSGETLATSRIGVLPSGLALGLVAGSGDSPAKVVVTGAPGVSWRLTGEGIAAHGTAAAEPLEIPLVPKGPPPAWLSFDLAAPGREPVTLSLPYPHPGARLIDGAGRESRARDLTLDDLREVRIVLAAAGASGQDFHLQLDLLASGSTGLRTHHVMRIGDAPAVIALAGYVGQIQQMLGSVDDPDAYVRLAVETDHPLLQMNIRRFGALLESSGPGKYRLSDIDARASRTGVVALALPLSGGSPVALAEELSPKGNLFSTAELAGAWLVYPGKDSSIRFRPEWHMGLPAEQETPEGGETPAAALLLQPAAAAELIEPVLKAMAADLDHDGWQRLDELKRVLAHLPLAAFQAWRSLSRQPDALAAALLRLSADERFCGRIHDELAVLWEGIPVETWVKAFARFRAWVGSQGLPAAHLAGLLDNRLKLLRAVVPGLDSTGDYLGSGRKGALKKPPVELVLPYHYQELRRTHQANARWPTELAAPLAAWLERQRLPRSIKKLSNTAYSDAVTYLPVFMAHVTAGKASLSALPGEPAYVRLVISRISEFDRGWYLYVHSLLVSYLLAADP